MPHNAFRRGDPDRIRAFRGTFMTLLTVAANDSKHNPDDPYLVGAETLLLSLESLGSRPEDEEVRNVARYLEQKEYIRVMWRNDGSGDFDAVRLLVKGMDLVERTIIDSAVLLSKRR